mmetsp:Transcript_91760/g.256280  ORF Transcript_91760/g.256280 Transcript_91760/m.256280 type:complete len:270 (+) Transcript_91760:1935-2744(+)
MACLGEPCSGALWMLLRPLLLLFLARLAPRLAWASDHARGEACEALDTRVPMGRPTVGRLKGWVPDASILGALTHEVRRSGGSSAFSMMVIRGLGLTGASSGRSSSARSWMWWPDARGDKARLPPPMTADALRGSPLRDRVKTLEPALQPARRLGEAVGDDTGSLPLSCPPSPPRGRPTASSTRPRLSRWLCSWPSSRADAACSSRRRESIDAKTPSAVEARSVSLLASEPQADTAPSALGSSGPESLTSEGLPACIAPRRSAGGPETA